MAKPKIRFNGYTEDWEQRKLNEVAEKICVGFVGTCEKFYTDESGVPMYRTGNLNGLSLNRDDLKYVTNEFHQHNQKSQLKAGDILIARHGDSGKAVNYESSEEANCLNIVIIRPDFKKCNYKFLTNCINSPECQKHIKSLSAGSTQAVINTSEIEKLGVVMPANIDEQNRIARYFSNLDHLITLHQRKCEQTKTLKKYMLQKMFPQDGEKVPQIRFEGFTEDWEQRKLGEVCQITMGQSPDGSTYSEEPSDYILVQGNADLKDGWVEPRIWTTQKTKTAQAGDLIMSVRAPAGAMGKTAYDVVLGRGVAGIKGNEFVYQLLVKMDSDGYWKKMAAGSTFESINSDVVKKAEILLPQDIEEQNKIGSYFMSLDHLITLHQRKCDELKEVKKFMLQNMFV